MMEQIIYDCNINNDIDALASLAGARIVQYNSFMWLTCKNKSEILKNLISCIDINKYAGALLKECIDYNLFDVLELLIAKNININIENDIALCLCIEQRRFNMINYLISHGAGKYLHLNNSWQINNVMAIFKKINQQYYTRVLSGILLEIPYEVIIIICEFL